MSMSVPKNYVNYTFSSRIYRKNKKNEKLQAIEECKRLYQKYYLTPSSALLKQLDENIIKLFLEKLKFKDISVISNLLSKYYCFQQIEISLSEINKPQNITKRKSYKPIILTKEEKSKIEKETKIRFRTINNMINKIIISISNHISISNSIILLSLNNIGLTKKNCDYLSKGFIKNNSIQSISITNSKISLNSYELLMESLLNHNLLYYLDLSNNNFGDKYGKMISRLIIRQSQRRDQVVWSYGLRNEIPLTNDYKKGLIFINLNGNNLSKDSADYITNSLYYDQYIRAIYLNENKFDNLSCKKFIYMMRKNLSILTIDLRGNPGYDNYIHWRLVMKMSKNIRYLYQQYKKGEYSEEEFENLKIFIDVSFFDVDIPQNVVDFYNNNLPQNNEEKEIKIKNEKNKINLEEKKIITNKKQEEDINYQNSNINKNIYILEENKKLHDENIRLKKQIIELKARNLQKQLGNKYNNNTNQNETNDSKSDIETDYQRVEILIKELNELMNKIDKKSQRENKKDIILNNNKNNEMKKEQQKIQNEIQEIVYEEKEKEKETKKKDKNNNNELNLINNTNDNNKNTNNNINIEKVEERKINENEIKNILDMQKKEEKFEEKDKESNESHLEDENGNVYNFDDLTEEEKMVILQQQLIIQRLQEEAMARGEQFDPQEYLEFLERQAREGENELSDQSSNKLNKSF